MSQKATIIQMLTDAGASGVTSREFNDAEIFRYSARIEELRKAGHQISTERVKGTLFRFILSGDASSLGAGGKAARTPRQEPEQTGGDLTSSPVTPLLSGNGSEVEMNSPLECASVAVTSSQAEADGREYETNQVDVHRGPVERAVCKSETPVSLSLFDTSGFEQGSSPYDAEAA